MQIASKVDQSSMQFNNLGFRPASDVLEIGPECRRLRRDGGWDAGGETARETENLATWGGESGRGRRTAKEIRGAGRVGRQNSRFSVFQRAGTQISRSGGSYVPEAVTGLVTLILENQINSNGISRILASLFMIAPL
jgi:hypothetical protein